MESAVAGSDEVGPAVVGLSAGAGSVDAGLFITSLISVQECQWVVHLATSTRFLRAKGDN